MRLLRELVIAVLAVYVVRWLDDSLPAFGAKLSENFLGFVVLTWFFAWGITVTYLAYSDDRVVAKRCPFRSFEGRLLWAGWIFVFYLSGFFMNSGMSSFYDPRTSTQREVKRSVKLAWQDLRGAPMASA
jgi:hypothetical protein